MSNNSTALAEKRPSGSYAFISQLRGWAAICVVVSHLVMMYFNGAASNAFTFILPVRNTEPLPYLDVLYRITEKLRFNFGAFGVALFFLISGFLISNSLQDKTSWGFIRKRLVRVYPVYAIGFSVTFGLMYLYICAYKGDAFPYGFKDWLMQVSLLRDWFWLPSLDGVSWTLETDLKFYLFAVIMLQMDIYRKPKGVFWGSVALGLISVLASKASQCPGLSIQAFAACYFLSFGCGLILYILLGLCLFNLFSGEWKPVEFAFTVTGVYLLFILASTKGALSGVDSTISNYTYALLVFSLFLLLRNRLPQFKFIGFISRISFSVYIVHGLNGYMLMSVLDHAGVAPHFCILIAIAATTLLATLFYKAVEEPLSRILRTRRKKDEESIDYRCDRSGRKLPR